MSTIRSVATWIDAARSASRRVGVEPSGRAGPSNSRSNAGVIVVRPADVAEVLEVEGDRAVVVESGEVLEDEVGVARLAERSQAHEFALPAVDAEPAIRGEGGIQQTDRVGESELAVDVQSMKTAVAHRRRRPLADAVDGEDRGRRER